MFNLFRRSQPHVPSAALIDALGPRALRGDAQLRTLAVVDRPGSYVGRRVSFFSVFDPAQIADRGVRIRDFADLDAYPDLVLGSGHVERNGAVVLVGSDPVEQPGTSVRSRADRTMHSDDEQLVFHDAT
jgi:hypothetical protein